MIRIWIALVIIVALPCTAWGGGIHCVDFDCPVNGNGKMSDGQDPGRLIRWGCATSPGGNGPFNSIEKWGSTVSHGNTTYFKPPADGREINDVMIMKGAMNSTLYFDATGRGKERGSAKTILSNYKGKFTTFHHYSGTTYYVNCSAKWNFSAETNWDSPEEAIAGLFIEQNGNIRWLREDPNYNKDLIGLNSMVDASGKASERRIYFNIGKTPVGTFIPFGSLENYSKWQAIESMAGAKIYGAHLKYNQAGAALGCCIHTLSECEFSYNAFGIAMGGRTIVDCAYPATISKNTIHHNRMGISNFAADDAWPEYGIHYTIAYNVIRENTLDGIRQKLGVYAGYEGNELQVYNNVIYGNGRFGINIAQHNEYPQAIRAHNNISTGNAVQDYRCDNAASILLTADYNSGARYDGKWLAGPHDVTKDALFIASQNGDFRLRAGSPCIEAGIMLGLNKDYYGGIVPQGTRPDMGIYEYPIYTDSDRDMLGDHYEVALYGTDPSNADTDGDYYSDGVEVAGQSDPLDPASHPSAYMVPAFGIHGYGLTLLTLLGVFVMKVRYFRRRKPQRNDERSQVSLHP